MHLRHLTLAVLLIFSTRGSAQGNKEYTIFGRIDGIGNAKVLLGNKPKNGYSAAFKVQYFDSCFSKDDHFIFKGHADELAFYSIEVPAAADGWVSVILENTKIEIKGSKDSIYRSKITCSSQNEIYNFYREKIYYPVLVKKRIIYDAIDSLRKLKDTVEIRRLEDTFLRPYNEESEANLYQFIEENPTNFGGLYELSELSMFINIDSARKYYLKLSDELKENTFGKKLRYRLFEYPELISLKKPMPYFSMPDTAGHIRNISAFRGKYVLIDFWASWCGPCLEELPQLKRIDSLYRSKGLQILGISMDTDRKLWTTSITRHKIKWINLSDLEGSDNKAALLLNVTAIPSRFLLDPDGNILLREASLPAIEKLLSDRLAN